MSLKKFFNTSVYGKSPRPPRERHPLIKEITFDKRDYLRSLLQPAHYKPLRQSGAQMSSSVRKPRQLFWRRSFLGVVQFNSTRVPRLATQFSPTRFYPLCDTFCSNP
jgi:hypothetical protein